MATSTRTRAPRAPVEGQTREVRTRESAHVFGNTRLLGPQIVVHEVFINGEWVPSTTRRSTTQKLVVGSVVRTTSCTRRIRTNLAVPSAAIAESLGQSGNCDSYYTRSLATPPTISVLPPRQSYIAVVTAVHGDAYVVQRIGTPYGVSHTSNSGVLTLRNNSRYDALNPASMERWASSNVDTYSDMVYRKSHLEAVSFAEPGFMHTLARVMRKPMTAGQLTIRRAALDAKCAAGRKWRYADVYNDSYCRAPGILRIRKNNAKLAELVRSTMKLGVRPSYPLLVETMQEKAALGFGSYSPTRTHLHKIVHDSVLPALLAWHKRTFHEDIYRAAGCGHYHHMDPSPLVVLRDGTVEMFCFDCTARNSELVELNDAMVFTHRGRVGSYMWSDGVRRFNTEPAIIGNYHSGKHVVGFLAPITQDKSGPTIGIELEVQGHNGHGVEGLAREMRDRVSPHLTPTQLKKYLHFEYDGSVTGGYEIVTGWTNHATHALLLHKLLVNDNGSMPFVGRLRSHDASCSCGLHVHIEKPKSLVHAAKIRYVMNGRAFEPLVKAVARRYNEQYCRTNGANVIDPMKDAAQVRKMGKAHTGTWRGEAAVTRNSINSLSASRYEITNFLPDKTVEFRVFKGSMKYATVMASIELSLAVWRYARDMPAAQMDAANLLAYISRPEWSSETRFLRLMLKAKGFNCRVPNVNKRVHATETASADAE